MMLSPFHPYLLSLCSVITIVGTLATMDFTYLGNAPHVMFSTNYTTALHVTMTTAALHYAGAADISVTSFEPSRWLTEIRYSQQVIGNLTGDIVGVGPGLQPWGAQSRSSVPRLLCNRFISRFSQPPASVILTSEIQRASEPYVIAVCNTSTGESGGQYGPAEDGGAAAPSLRVDIFQWSGEAMSTTTPLSIETLVLNSNVSSAGNFQAPFYCFISNVSNFQSEWRDSATVNDLVSVSSNPFVMETANDPQSSPWTVYQYGLATMQEQPIPSLTVGDTSAYTAMCILPTVEVFVVTKLNPYSMVPLKSKAPQAVEDCDFLAFMSITTAARAQMTCLNDERCVGFTTYYVNASGEVPWCYYTVDAADRGMTLGDVNTVVLNGNAGDALDSSSRQNWRNSSVDRLWYEKPRGASGFGSKPWNCSFLSSNSGIMTVTVRNQNYDYEIFVDGVYQSTCRATMDFACNQFLDNCASVPVYVDSIVTVVPLSLQNSSSRLWCHAYNSEIVVHVAPSGSSAKPEPEFPQIPPTNVSYIYATTGIDNPFVTRTVYVANLGLSNYYRWQIRVSNLTEFAVDVRQTGFGEASRNYQGIIFVSAPYFSSSCGGLRGFYDSSTSGTVDHVEQSYLCAMSTLSFSTDTPATLLTQSEDQATIHISADLTPIRGAASRPSCASLELVLRLRFDRTSTSAGFMFAGPTDYQFQTLLFVPSDSKLRTNAPATTSAIWAKNFFPNTTAAIQDVTLQLLTESSAYKSGWYYKLVPQQRLGSYPLAVDSTAFLASYTNTMRPNVTLGCVIDTITREYAFCRIPVPQGSQYVSVMVEDSQFYYVPITVTVERNDGTNSVAQTATCGGTSGFVDGTPGFGNCGYFRSCAFFTIVPGSAAFVTIRISQNAELASYLLCSYTLVANVIFTPPSSSCGGFTCALSGECLPDVSRVCDGIIDCLDQTDESQCDSWLPVETDATIPIVGSGSLTLTGSSTGATLTLTPIRVDTNHSGADACRTAALVAGANVVAATNSNCTLYVLTVSDTGVLVSKSPSITFSLGSIVTVASGSVVYANLASRNQYTHCTNEVSCSGNGVTFGFQASCRCVCFVGYEGDQCQRYIAAAVGTSPNLAAIAFKFNASSFDPSSSTQVYWGNLGYMLKVYYVVEADCSYPFPDAADSTRLISVCKCSVGTSCFSRSVFFPTSLTDQANLLVKLSEYLLSMLLPPLVGLFIPTQPLPETIVGGGEVISGSIVFQKFPITSVVQLSGVALPISGYAVTDLIVTINTAASVSASRRSGVWRNATLVINCSDTQNPLLASSIIRFNTQEYLAFTINLQGKDPISAFSFEARDRFGTSGLINSLDIAWQRSLQTPSVVAPSSLVSIVVDFSPWLFAGIALLIVSVVMVVVAWVLGKRHREEMEAFVTSNRDKLPPTSDAVRVLEGPQDEMERMEEEDSDAEDGNAKAHSPYEHVRRLLKEREFHMEDRTCLSKDRSAFILLLVMLNLWIAGIFLILVWHTGSGVDNNTWLLVERFSTSKCGDALLASTPQVALMVPDDASWECKQRSQFGSTSAPVFLAAWCQPNGTHALVAMRIGSTAASCAASSVRYLPANVCLPSTSVVMASDGSTSTMWFGDLQDSTFVTFSCATPESVQSRFTSLKAYDNGGLPSESTTVVDVPKQLQQSLANTGDAFYFPSVVGKVMQTVTSYAPFRVETVIQSDVLTSSIPQQLIVQLGAELFSDPKPSFNSPITEAIEETNRYSLTAPGSDATPYVPFFREAPVGRIYNGFNTTSAKKGSDAGPASTKYFSVQNSFADLGRFIDISTAVQGDGMSISLFLRCTTESYGFAFAVTDGLIDRTTMSSPILDRLMALELSNADSSSWFNADLHIYNGLLVNGPKGVLSFVYATPSTSRGSHVQGRKSKKDVSKTTSILSWDLSALGLKRVFNGLWHYVQVFVIFEDGKMKAQLVVDGVTSQTEVGWKLCLSQDIYPIQSFQVGDVVPVFNASSQRFYSGGILWSGYFNGGVSHLEFSGTVPNMFTVWLSVSQAIKDHNSINQTGYLVLGWLLIVISAIAFVYMSYFSGREMVEVARREEAAYVESVCLRYIAAIRHIPHDAVANQTYQPLKYSTAKRWLKLTDAQFSQFLEELKQSTARVAEELYRVLYLAGDAAVNGVPKNVAQPLPGASAWNELLDKETKFRESQRWSFLCFHFEPKEDVDPIDVATVLQSRRGDTASSSVFESSSFVNHVESIAAVAEKDDKQQRNAAALANLDKIIALRSAASTKRSDVGQVNTGRLQIGGQSQGTATQGASNNSGFQLPVEVKQLLLPVLNILQQVYVWMSTSTVAKAYDEYFKRFFSFISIDVVDAFNQIPPLVTPLVQMFFGLVALSLLMYFTATDEYRFSWYVAQYTLRRDQLDEEAQEDQDLPKKNEENNSVAVEGTNPLVPSQSQPQPQDPTAPYTRRIFAEFPQPFGNQRPCPYQYHLSVLPVNQSKKIDRFVGVSGADGNEITSETIQIEDDEGNKFVLEETSESRRVPPEARASLLSVSQMKSEASSESVDKTKPLVLREVGIRCWKHTDRRLAPQTQTDVWPFAFVPSCCIVINGKRCGVDQGILYTCGKSLNSKRKGDPDDDGRLCLCDFAVCERHYRGTPVDGVVADIIGMIRTAQDRGMEWVMTTILIVAANAAYTPILKTAIMILACHPSFQCVFEHCHDFSDQEYLLAAFLCITVIVCFGLGLPLSQSLQLRRRIRVLHHVFFDEAYKGKYEETGASETAAELLRQEQERVSKQQSKAEGTSSVLVEMGRKLAENVTELTGAAVATMETAVVSVVGGARQDPGRTSHAEKKLVSGNEWGRFLTSDPTVLGTLYKTLEFDWIYLSPIILLWKVILLFPPIFIPAGTFEQAAGIAATEFAFALFMFITAPFIAPMVDLMYRVGCIHQLAFLGVQALDQVSRSNGDSNGLSTILILLTLIYLAFSVFCILWTVVGPQVAKARDTKESTKALEELGFQYSLATTLYATPSESAFREQPNPPTVKFNTTPTREITVESVESS